MKGRTSCRPATLWTAFLLVLLASTASDQVYSIPISSSNTSANATTRLAFSFTSEFDISSDATFLIGLSSAFTINDANQSTFKVFEDDVPSRMSVVEFISPPVRSSLQCNCSANFQSLKQFVTDALALDNDTISHYILISQPEDTRSRILNQTKLRFSLSNAQNPPYAMRIASPLGFLAIYNSTLKNQNIDLQSFVPWISILDGLDISPQNIWHPSISMNSTLMGRSASISISFDLSVSDLHQAMIFTFPKTYRLSSDTYRVAVNGAECSWKVKREQLFIEGKLSDKDINVTIDVIQPSMEGPIGSSLRIDTTNSDGLLMDQGFIDLSHIFLSRASILLNRTQISLREGGASSTYSLQLEESSRPTDDTQLRIRIVHRFTFSPNCANYSVQLSPSYVVYSMANWTQITVIDVSMPQDLRIQCVNWNSLHHEIELPSNQTDLWSQPNDIALSLTDTTTPTIRLSTRHLGLLSEQNVSYAIQLLFQPEELLEIGIESIDRNTQTPLSLLNVQPLIVRFHPNDWRPKSVWIHVANASIDTGTAIILRHSIRSAFSDVFFTPQSDVLGYIQPSNSCVPCPPGSALAKWKRECISCPSGHFCQGGCAFCEFETSSNDTLEAFCTSTLQPQQCPRGTFSIGGQHVCTSCPNKSKCPFPNTKSIACPDGETHNTERDECISCPQGFSCSIFDSDPRPCASGTFSAQRQDECIACPMGTFSLEKQDRCTFCPAGYMCPLTDGSANALCPIGTYTIAGGAVTTCTKCPPGFACPRPSDHEPIPCVPGTFSIGCSAICTPCSSGFACPDSTRNISIACEIGTYSLGAQASCLPCPAGFSCSSISSQDFIPCPLGTYSLSGNAFCIQCPRGSYCDTPQVVKNCSLGTFSVESSSSCSDCPPGYECPRPQDVPRLCPIGYFSPGGWEACALCRPGYRCSPGSTTSTPIQDECPMGSYCNPSYSLTLCPLGTFGNVTAGQSLTHACHSCLEGYYCDIGSTRNTMRLCPPGYFCPAGTQRSSQYPCPYGTYNPQYGQIDSNACSMCPAGRYCGQATSDPTPCPRGSFCKEGTASSDQYPCPAGTFSDRTGLVQALECSICQVAAYCPEKSSSPTLCPAGTYNPNTGAAAVYECMECPSGWMCPRIGTPMVQQRCALGHYCPKGTVLPLACPAGTYTNRNDLIRMEECTVCPQRHACVSGTGGDATPMQMCALGHYCPNQTAYATQFPCLPGTYTSQTNLANEQECDICPNGMYCVGGKDCIDGNCASGHYCPQGTSSPTEFPCPSGYFTAKTDISHVDECEECPMGTYCPQGSTTPIPCKGGTYAERHKSKDAGPGVWPSCVSCPAGNYCPLSSVRPLPCGVGMFSSANAEKCLPCRPGRFCASNTTSFIQMEMELSSWKPSGFLYGKCLNGTYCPSGTDHEPYAEIDACPMGYVCPKGTLLPIACPAGTFNPLTGQDALEDCIATPEGMYSIAASILPTGICAPGFYCPRGSTTFNQFPCPLGTYLNRTKGASVIDCSICIAGKYCPQASSMPRTCPEGYYCPIGVSNPIVCPIGTFSSDIELKTREECTRCPPGRFCDATALVRPTGACEPGYFCVIGSTTSTPSLVNDTNAGVCPKGFYCVRGTAFPTACPAGTISDSMGLQREDQCNVCPAGKYCQQSGQTNITGECMEGYYCPPSATRPDSMLVPAGYFTTKGLGVPLPCPLGYYSPMAKSTQCLVCVEGTFCPTIATITPLNCFRGYYCPSQSIWPLPCPMGTFSNSTNLIDSTQCTPCRVGMYCDGIGRTTPTDFCAEGYVCSQFSISPTPNGNDGSGFPCPRGHYCPEGALAPSACPRGTFRNASRGSTIEACALCPGGMYCNDTALIAPSGVCEEGFYCELGSTRIDGSNGKCPPGSYCPKGSTRPIECAEGTYAKAPGGHAVCALCPEGYYCDGNTTLPTNCPVGFYCPFGTGKQPQPCPIGTWSSRTTLSEENQCEMCAFGMYCSTLGLSQMTGFCAAGFMCSLGSMTPYGKNASVSEMECPKGHFCPLGTAHPLPCPMGTYANTTKLEMETQCTLCEEGAYCATTGLTHVQGSCDAGYFCKRGNVDATPTYGVTNHSVNDAIQIGGNPCPKGFFCPKGTSEPLPCPMGTYANEMGASECAICPAGYVCPKNSITFDAHICPLGYFCPSGTTSMNANPCPRGTYGATEKLQSEAQCTSAPGGMFIDTYASIRPVGLCALGFYCSGGSTSKTPIANTLTGGPCPMGSYCPEGSSRPFTCPAGRYCTSSDIERSLPCQAGFYCVQGAYTPTPTGQSNGFGTIGNVCPQGHYCPENCSHPIPCPPGTYSDITQLQKEEECRPCTPGFICNASGIIRPLHACPEGYFCPGNDAQATLLCPRGAACALGSMSPTMCARGSFNDAKGALKCKECPAGYVCSTEGTIQPEECPRGFYCPANTTRNTLFPCLPGTFGNDTRLIDATSCTKCPEGFYCNGNGQTDAPTGRCANGFYCQLGAKTSMPNDTTGGMCEKGFVCLGGASLPSPTDTITGHACHRGFYCPKGAGQQLACPPGTFNPIEQGECLECPEGMYCVATTHTPKVCPYGSYCPAGTHLPLPCPSGTYGNDTRLSESSQCTRCTAGNYCVNGRITGTCAAGYVCRKHNSSPFPEESHDEGGACPLGHYCPEGIINPVPCPSTTARLTRYGVKMQDCEPCPDGMDCTDGARTRVCPKGFYCRSGTLPIACPMGTYNNETGKAQRQDCRECNAGRLCNDTGIIDMDSYRCPRGSYCVRGAITSNWCPDGTYGEFDGAKRIDECVQCPEGSYCSQGASRPQVCPSSTYCPLGSGQPLPCPLGFYCTYNSWLPLNCPRGYVCPFGSATPIRCQCGFYCPGNSDFPLPCPLGTIGRATPTNGSYSTSMESCEKCPKGTYADTYLQKECTSCERGFICLGGTTSKAPMDVDVDHGYPCPAGYFCPQASHQAIACPAGTYQPKETAGNDSDCLLCPLGTYQMNTAATNCIPCSRSSFTLLPGGVQCKCKGSHRAFQRSDGACTCEPGFQYYENGVFQSDQDSDIDCQPIVYDRCTTSQIRADNGSCVDISMTDCSRVCPKGSGVLLQSAGVCQCEQQSVLDDICNAQCRRESVRLAVNATTKQLQLYDPKAQERIDMENDGMIAKVSCGKDDECPLHTLVLDTFGLAGSYDIPFDMKSKRRRLSTSQKSLLFNPIVCVRSGGGIAFDLRHGISSFGRVSYPMYLKDSMLNTNPHFDYGAFREVAMRIDSNASKVSVFAFTFTDPGMYVFGSSGNSEARTIVSVMQQGTICPVEAPIVPLNEQNLIAIGAVRAADIIVAPDWSLIAGLLVGLFVLLASVIMALYVFHRKRWKTQKCMEGTYRNGNQTDDVVALYADTQSLKDAETYEENRSYWKQSKEMRNGRNAFTKTVENGLLGMRHFLQSELQRIHLGNEMIQWLAAKSFVSLRIAERNEFVRVDTSKNALVSFWKDTAAMDLNERERYRVKKREMLDRMIQSADNVQKAFGIEGMPRKSDWNVGDLARTLLAESMKGHALDVVEDGSGRESRTMERGRKALRELKDAMDARSTLSALQMTEEHRQKLTDTVFDAICAKLLESLDDGKECDAMESVKKAYERMQVSRNAMDTQAEAVDAHCTKLIDKMERVFACVESMQTSNADKETEKRLTFLLRDLLKIKEWERRKSELEAIKDEETNARNDFQQRLKSFYDVNQQSDKQSIARKGVSLGVSIEKEIKEIRKMLSSLVFKGQVGPREADSLLGDTSWLTETRDALVCMEKSDETNALRIASVEMTSKTDDNILDQRYKEEAEAIEEEYRKELDELEREWEDESIDEKCVLFSENALWEKVSNSESPYFDLLRQRQTPYEVYGTDNKRTEETLCKEMIANAVRETLKDWEHLIFDCKKQFENTIQRIQSTENIQNDAIVFEMEKARDAYAFELEERTRQMTFQLLTEREISQNALCETLESMREKELFPISHDAKTQKWIDEMMENTVKAESRRIAAELISGHGSEAMEVRDPSGFVEEEIRKLAATQREALREQQKENHADAILRKERLRERIQKRVRTSEINEQVDAIDRIAEEENASLTTDCDAFLSNATKSLTEFVQQTISDVDGDIRNCIAMYDAEKDELALKLCEMRTERIRLYDANESDQMREEEETHKANAWEQLNASHKANLQSLHAKALSTAKEKKEQAQAQEIKAQEELDRIRSVHLRERQQFDETLRIDQKNGENRLKQRIAEKRQRHKLKMNKIVVEENVKNEEMASAEEKETDEWKSQIATEQLLIDRIRWCQLERAKAEAMQRAIDTTFAIQMKGTNNAVEMSFASTETKKKTFESILEEKKSPEEMEQLLRRCKDAHEQEAEKLRKELQSERQRQEHALKDRIRVRREKKMVSVLPIGIEDAKGSLEKEFQEQEQALEASIEANEAAAWSLIREKQQQELRALTVKAQAIAQRKQQKANELERFAAEELQRLSGEHVEESKQLEALLGSEKQRHEKRVQERVAQRRERKLSQLASVIEDGVSPRNEETFTSMEATAAIRIDTAKEAAERASFEAHKAIQIVDEMKAESLRAIEVERVAKEYAEKQSELKRTHYVDMMTQRKRLEARINAKKQRKLMDLDSKREKELLALSRSPISEKEKVSTHTMEADDLLLRFQAAKEAIDAIEWKRIPFDEAMRTECSDQRMESYLCTLERLMNGNIVPEKLSIELAIELILNPFHQSEVAAMYTKHKAERKNVHRNMLKHLTEKRTEVRTRLLSQSTASEMEAILADIDTLFHEKMKRLEAQVDEKMEVAHGSEFTQMRERHQSEVDFLRKYTNNRTVEWKTTSGDACQMSEACDAEKSVAVEMETLRVNVEREVEALEIAFGNEMKAQSDRWNALLETESEAFESVWEKSNTNSADKKVQWKMMREKLCERQQFQITRLENRLQEEKRALWKAFAEKERLLRSEMTLKETTRDARQHIDSKASRDSFKEYQCHVHKELAKVCNHHTLHVKRIENSSFLIPTDFSKISHQLKESVQYFRFMVKSMTEDLTSLTLFEADTLANSTNLFYNPRERVVHVSSKFVETCDIGQSIVLLLFGVCRMESQIDEITDPKFISHCVELLIRSYQYMFDHRSFAVVPEHNQPRDCSTRWKSRAKEIQSFLVSLENSDVH